MQIVIPILKDELACLLVTHDYCDSSSRCFIRILVMSELHADALDGGAA